MRAPRSKMGRREEGEPREVIEEDEVERLWVNQVFDSAEELDEIHRLFED